MPTASSQNLLIALLTLVATLPAVAQPSQGERRWRADAFEVSLALSAAVPAGQAKHALEHAMKAWHGVGVGPQMRLDPHPAMDAVIAADGRNQIVFITEGWQHDPRELALAFKYVDASGTIVEADIAVNAEHHRFFVEGEEEDSYDLAGLLTHELGHALGLEHIDELPDAVMFPEMQDGVFCQRDLTEADHVALVKLYDDVDLRSQGCSASSAPGTLPLLSLVGGLLALRRRPRRAANVSLRAS